MSRQVSIGFVAAALRAPDGWLTVAGLFFLNPGVNRVGADPTSDVVLPAGRTPSQAGRVIVSGDTGTCEPLHEPIRLNGARQDTLACARPRQDGHTGDRAR